MDNGMVFPIILLLVGVQISSTSLIWYKLGKVEKAARCPFGNCPVFRKASDEAAK